MSITEKDDLEFQHLIDLPNCECVFCSTKEKATGRTRLFLIFHEEQGIYMRDGVRDTWDELKDEHQYNCVRSGFNSALLDRRIPCFTV